MSQNRRGGFCIRLAAAAWSYNCGVCFPPPPSSPLLRRMAAPTPSGGLTIASPMVARPLNSRSGPTQGNSLNSDEQSNRYSVAMEALVRCSQPQCPADHAAIELEFPRQPLSTAATDVTETNPQPSPATTTCKTGTSTRRARTRGGPVSSTATRGLAGALGANSYNARQAAQGTTTQS